MLAKDGANDAEQFIAEVLHDFRLAHCEPTSAVRAHRERPHAAAQIRWRLIARRPAIRTIAPTVAVTRLPMAPAAESPSRLNKNPIRSPS